MTNKYLERELKQNISKNQIFEYQTHEDLRSIKDFLAKHKIVTNIIVEFDGEKMANSTLLHAFPYDSDENNIIWEYFVATQVLKAIRNNLYVDYSEDKNKQEQIIYNGLKENYSDITNNLVTREEIKKLIDIINTPIRLHFIIMNYRSECLCDELSRYLQYSYPTTMIYLDEAFYTDETRVDDENGKQPLWKICNYERFRHDYEGESSKTIRDNCSLSMKQKVKKYEEV